MKFLQMNHNPSRIDITNLRCTRSDMLDKWARDYMGGDDAYPGDGGGFTWACSVSETGEVQGCQDGSGASSG